MKLFSVFIICLIVLSLPGACWCYDPATAYGSSSDSGAGRKLVSASELEERFEALFEGLSSTDSRATSAYTSIDSVLGPDEDIDWLSVLAYANSKLPDTQNTASLLIPATMKRAIENIKLVRQSLTVGRIVVQHTLISLGRLPISSLIMRVSYGWMTAKSEFGHVWDCIQADSFYGGVKLDDLVFVDSIGEEITWLQFFEGMANGHTLDTNDFEMVFDSGQKKLTISTKDLNDITNCLVVVNEDDLGQLQGIPDLMPGHIDLGSIDGVPGARFSRYVSNQRLMEELRSITRERTSSSPLSRGVPGMGVDTNVGSPEYPARGEQLLNEIHTQTKEIVDSKRGVSLGTTPELESFSTRFGSYPCEVIGFAAIILISVAMVALSIVNACHHH